MAEPKRVYVDGVFDLFHAGHVAFLHKASQVCDGKVELIVGVITDADAGWKRKPVMSHAERVAVVRECRSVHAVIEQPPLVLDDKFLDANRIDYVVHGDDDKQERFFAAAIARNMMKYVPYTAGVSTSDIIKRVQKRSLPELEKIIDKAVDELSPT